MDLELADLAKRDGPRDGTTDRQTERLSWFFACFVFFRNWFLQSAPTFWELKQSKRNKEI